jgi:hypothetical protein
MDRYTFTRLPHNTFSISDYTEPGGPNSPTDLTNPGGVMQTATPDPSSDSTTDTDSATTPLPTLTPTSSSTTDTASTPTTTTSMTSATQSPSSSPSAIAALAGHRSKAGPIAGGVLGVLAGLALLVFLGLALRRRRRRSAPRGSPLESGQGGTGFGYSDPKPRSRPASRVASTHTPHAASVGTIESFGAAQTWESGGTLAGVQDDDDAYLAKLADADDAPVVPVLAAPAPAPTNAGVRSRRAASQDYSVGAYPPVPGMASPTSNPDLKAGGGGARKVPRKKPVPRYSEDGKDGRSHSQESASPPAPASPFGDGRPVHYLIPDMPPPQH